MSFKPTARTGSRASDGPSSATERGLDPGSPGSQTGIALLLAIIHAAVLSIVVASLVTVATTERMLSAVGREAIECRYAAEAILAYAIAELQLRPTWDEALEGSLPAPLADGLRTPTAGGSRRLDLDSIGRSLPRGEPGAWGADRPVWQLFAWGPAEQLAPGLLTSSIYVAVWAADDERDGDRNPERDSNGRLLLRAEAFGPIRGRRGVLVTVAREAAAPAALRVLDWHFS